MTMKTFLIVLGLIISFQSNQIYGAQPGCQKEPYKATHVTCPFCKEKKRGKGIGIHIKFCKQNSNKDVYKNIKERSKLTKPSYEKKKVKSNNRLSKFLHEQMEAIKKQSTSTGNMNSAVDYSYDLADRPEIWENILPAFVDTAPQYSYDLEPMQRRLVVTGFSPQLSAALHDPLQPSFGPDHWKTLQDLAIEVECMFPAK